MNLNIFLVMIVTMTLSIVCGNVFIPKLHKLKLGQVVREEGPKNHIIKNGTPTMGGFIFIVPIIIASFLYMDLSIKELYPVIALILFGLIGFIDDFAKISKGSNLGLTARQKTVFMIIISLVLALIAKEIYGTNLYIPMIRKYIDFNSFYIPFIMLVYIGASNAVNLTDGIDGLATTVTIVALIFLGIIFNKFALESNIMFSSIAIGALAGFLYFNRYPAKTFMGDTGSLGLGGMLVALTLNKGLVIILVLVGIVYVFETLSVIVQVVYFKLTGKRIFKMSPIHHHYEMSGFSENKIVIIFSLIGIVYGIISVIII